jgi:hypothetical protein
MSNRLELPQVTLDEVLVMRTYLILNLRENEDKPFGFMLFDGAQIASQLGYFQPDWKIYLLPETTRILS